MLHHVLHKGLVAAHAVDHEQPLKELLFLFRASQGRGGNLGSHVSDDLADGVEASLFFSLFLLEEVVELDHLDLISLRSSSLVEVIVLKEMIGVEERHETDIDVVLHAPHPLARESNAELRAHSLTVSSHEQSEEASLWHILIESSGA